MIVDGTITTVEKVKVDVSTKSLIDIVLGKLSEKYPRYRDIGYIKDGYIYTYSNTCSYPEDIIEYNKTRVATSVDYELVNFVEKLKELFSNDD